MIKVANINKFMSGKKINKNIHVYD